MPRVKTMEERRRIGASVRRARGQAPVKVEYKAKSLAQVKRATKLAMLERLKHRPGRKAAIEPPTMIAKQPKIIGVPLTNDRKARGRPTYEQIMAAEAAIALLIDRTPDGRSLSGKMQGDPKPGQSAWDKLTPAERRRLT